MSQRLTVAPPRTGVSVAIDIVLTPARKLTREEAKEILVKLAIELTDATKIDAYADSLFSGTPFIEPGKPTKLKRVK
jgi:hypothetical protein